jgi:cytochrome c553
MIKKEFLMALSVSALLLGGCVDSSTGAAAKAEMEGEQGHKTEAKVEKKKAEAPAPAVEEKKAEAPAPAVEEKKAETPAPAVEEKKAETPAPAVEEKKAEAPAPAVEEKKASTDVDTTACAGCHGANFEKKALGKSKIVNNMKKDEIVKALKGYKDGSYGGAMKGMMKTQADSLDDAKIEAIANKVGK